MKAIDMILDAIDEIIDTEFPFEITDDVAEEIDCLVDAGYN